MFLPPINRLIFIILVSVCLQCCLSVQPNRSTSTTPSPTQFHPIMKKLEQLKRMEESSLSGWYEMVNKFLTVIRPDQRTLEYVINFTRAHHALDPQETVVKIATMNVAFLMMVLIGILYVIVMLVTAFVFLCCRCCGRCGAKDSQKQRRSDNCWKTIHMFSLILMVAFLVVPITCMCIINEHMKHSSPYVKGNITEVFNILIQFANQTDKDVDRESSNLGPGPINDFTAFKNDFVERVQKNISESIDNEKLEDVKKIVSWVAIVEENAKLANSSILLKAVDTIKTKISNIRQQMKSAYNCSNSSKKICKVVLQPILLEQINIINQTYSEAEKKMDMLMKFNFSEITNAVDQIQNPTILRSKIENETEALKSFADENMPKDDKGKQRIKEEVKFYTDQVRKYSTLLKKETKEVFAETDGYEPYRYWIMFGIAIVLLVPVVFLVLGLTCGCCGYKKDRHPTKRSSSSNCGGFCLILAVYWFFLVSSVLMLITIGLFVFGGNMQTFVCSPLYQPGFKTLDEMKDMIVASDNSNSSLIQELKPSLLLEDCKKDKSIVYALGLVNESDGSSYEKFFKQSGVMLQSESDDIDMKLKISLVKITSGIRDKLMQFTFALNVPELKNMPEKLKDFVTTARQNVSDFVHDVTVALKQDLGENANDVLHFVNDTAASLYKALDDFENKLNDVSAILMKIYHEAESYKEKIQGIEDNLYEMEEKLPRVVRSQLFESIASSSGLKGSVENIGKCFPVWVAFDMTRMSICEFIVYPLNGFWFGLGWALVFIIPTILVAVKLSRYYLRMKYDDDSYITDCGEAMPLEDMSRAKPFSYTNPGAMSWMPQFSPHQNYMVHPTSNAQTRHFHYK